MSDESPFSAPAHLGTDGLISRGLSRNADEAIIAFRAMRQTIRGTLSPDIDSAERLAREVAAKLGCRPNLRGPESHRDGPFHFHLQDFPEWHFWFLGGPLT